MTFLKNAWYAAGWADEITHTLTHRTILNEPIVFYRMSTGESVALHDQCPHRFAPLHLGQIVNDCIQCGYHGLQFDCHGKCVVSPFEARIPKAAKVKRYALVERYGVAWIFMGDAAIADASQIPDFSCIVDEKRTCLRGSLPVKANYELVVDNLADLSHANFLHGSYLDKEGVERTEHSVDIDGETVYSKFSFPAVKIPPIWGRYFDDSSAIVDRWSEIRWDAPCNVLLHAGVTRTGEPRSAGIEALGVHLVTPETDTSSHYLYCHCRDYKIDDPETNELIREWQKVAFSDQDKPMLEAQQVSLRGEELMSKRPLLLGSDAGAVRIRRLLKARIEAERGQVSAPVAAFQ
jgi:vanillate O-demethylase monooxygenase subunit